jgi:DNA-binding HxlR family transcriptional regulator
MAQKPGYGQFCPIAVATEVLGQRWTPLVIRELLLGSTRFNDLQRGVPRMSPALLARRLRELQFAGIVERRRGAAVEYHLTPAGRELFPVVEKMGLWAQRWLRHKLADASNLDPDLLMWDIRRTVVSHARPDDERYVAEFQLSGAPVSRRRYWLVVEGGSVDLCYKDPGFDADLFIASSLRVLTQVWLGHLSVDQALHEGRLRLHGSRRDLKAFRSWFALSPFAPAARASAAADTDADIRIRN